MLQLSSATWTNLNSIIHKREEIQFVISEKKKKRNRNIKSKSKRKNKRYFAGIEFIEQHNDMTATSETASSEPRRRRRALTLHFERAVQSGSHSFKPQLAKMREREEK